MGGTCTNTYGHGEVWPGLLPRVMSGSKALFQLESVLMSVVHVATKGHSDVSGLGCSLRQWGPYTRK